MTLFLFLELVCMAMGNKSVWDCYHLSGEIYYSVYLGFEHMGPPISLTHNFWLYDNHSAKAFDLGIA